MPVIQYRRVRVLQHLSRELYSGPRINRDGMPIPNDQFIQGARAGDIIVGKKIVPSLIFTASKVQKEWLEFLPNYGPLYFHHRIEHIALQDCAPQTQFESLMGKYRKTNGKEVREFITYTDAGRCLQISLRKTTARVFNVREGRTYTVTSEEFVAGHEQRFFGFCAVEVPE